MVFTNFAAADTVTTFASAGGFVALALYLRKVFRSMGLDNDRVDAERDIIKGLRDEVTRMAMINTEMSAAIMRLQLEVINLRNENTNLTSEIHALRNENANLTSEISALRNENAALTHEVLKFNDKIMRWDKKCSNCEHRKSEG